MKDEILTSEKRERTGTGRPAENREALVEALRESERRFRQMAESIREVFWLADAKTRQPIYVSPACEEIWGRTPADLLSSPQAWMASVHPEDLEAVRAWYLGRRGAEARETDHRIVRPDGSIRWIHVRSFGVTDGEGKVVRLAGIAEDVTGRKKTELALRGAEELWRSLVENSTDFIAVVGADFRFSFVNRTAPGIAVEEAVGRSIWDFTPPGQRRIVEKVLGRVFSSGESLMYESRGFGPEGAPAWYETLCVPVKRDGRVHSIMLISTDITERKQLQLSLEARIGFQNAVAELSLSTIEAGSAADIASAAAAAVEKALGVERAEVWVKGKGGRGLNPLAGPARRLGATAASQARYTLRLREPVVVTDLGDESRFRVRPFERDIGLVSGASVVIPGARAPRGVLSAHSKKKRPFSAEDIRFLQSVAGVLGRAFGRRTSR